LERASAYRPGTSHDVVSLTKFSLRMLARRALALEVEIVELDPMNQGLTKNEAFRCPKRYIAREVYNHLPRQQLALDSP
jgi:hypothetical protein